MPTVHQMFNYAEQDLGSKYRSFSPTLFLVKENASLNEGEDGLCPERFVGKVPAAIHLCVRNYRV